MEAASSASGSKHEPKTNNVERKGKILKFEKRNIYLWGRISNPMTFTNFK